MARLYTGQHGEFYFFVRDGVFGDTTGFDISAQAGAASVSHSIVNAGSVGRNNNSSSTGAQRNTQRRAAWERAGWVRANDDDYPAVGDTFTANGNRATMASGWRWRARPLARPVIPGSYRRIGTVRNWSFSNTGETIDATVLGNTYRNKLAGLKGVTGQAQLMYYRPDDDSDGPISNILDAFFFQDTETVRGDMQVLFRLQHSGSGTRDFNFPAVITNFTMNCSVGEVVTVDVTFEAMGEPYKQADSI